MVGVFKRADEHSIDGKICPTTHASLRNGGKNHLLVVPPALPKCETRDFAVKVKWHRQVTPSNARTRTYILMKSMRSMLWMSSVIMTYLTKCCYRMIVFALIATEIKTNRHDTPANTHNQKRPGRGTLTQRTLWFPGSCANETTAR
jgi:hypothetical protein